MSWRPDHFLVHCAFGLVVLFFVWILRTLGGPGVQQCCLLLLYPIAGWLISWWLPRGAPGASFVVAMYFVSTFPSQGGPTAKTLSTAFSVFLAGGMLVCEVTAAFVRLAKLRKGSSQGPDGA